MTGRSAYLALARPGVSAAICATHMSQLGGELVLWSSEDPRYGGGGTPPPDTGTRARGRRVEDEERQPIDAAELIWTRGTTEALNLVARSWGAANPPKVGVNWASSLEVAFRAMSWLWALHLFRESPALTPALYARVVGVLYVHGRHLEDVLDGDAARV